jgi:pyruvate dehydrogenase E2 component (dihydrolipoamide acetyltransferase)
MADETKVKVPDIGGVTGVDVIEVLVKEGDTITKDTSLVTLESDKASMEIPSPIAGVVRSLQIKKGDKVSEGDVILTLVADDAAPALVTPPVVESEGDKKSKSKSAAAPAEKAKKSEIKKVSASINVPDIGGAAGVDVIEILVKEGDVIAKDTPLITLESDKASMEIPSPMAGVVAALQIKIGDKVSEGDLILTLISDDNTALESETSAASVPVESETKTQPQPSSEKSNMPERVQAVMPSSEHSLAISAGPAVRRMARELGVNLADVKGSGRKSRISKEDVVLYVKNKINQKSSGGLVIADAPRIDFSKFGAIEIKPLNKIKRLTAVNVHRSWVTIPHVTQFDEADITELEAFRKAEMAKTTDVKLTILAFVCKIVSRALAVYPQFNASLDSSGENLIYKQYFNIGIAVETPNGLVVPVIKDVDRLPIFDIAKEMARLSVKARDKGLMPTDMNGGCFTISSLGGIGGTGFTPIVNSPEVAILGLSRSSMKPIYEDGAFKPRLMLPLSLSYDHRVIDGAEAARFTRFISEGLSDIRQILL